MLTLHHLEQSRSFRILWALEELGLDYQIEFYRRQPDYTGPDSLKAIHPLGKAPILTDDGHVLAESGAILEYLQSQYDQESHFKPTDPAALRDYIYWMHYAEGSLMPLLVFQLVISKVGERVPFLIRPLANKITDGIRAGFVQPRLKDHIAFLEQYLGQHEYVAGQFSFADIQMSFPLEAMATRLQGHYPNIQKYLAQIHVRPAYQQAKARDPEQAQV
ncbi:glutathione S-transferase [Acinetobacter radioresistens]|uniref:glutathione S-transferase n=1 Tax=Acinetobacter radioresistens TaxID=40216 RepID=UPI0002F88570|nr:glutathione S-transferase [Acinetobacter radioresistens]